MTALVVEQVDTSIAAERGQYVAAWNEVWPEFAMTDGEFQVELDVGGEARFWLVRPAAGAEAIGTLTVERTPWNGEDAPPIVMALLPERLASEAAYAQLLPPCEAFSREQGFTEMRVLAWERERVLIEFLLGRPGWREVGRDVDVGLDLTGATGYARELPAGYELTTSAQRPDLEQALYECLGDVLPDIPGDEPVARVPYDDWRTWRASDMCRPEACFIVLDPAGEIAGFAELEFPAMLEDVAWHGFTAVSRAHRGRGIASALKSATIAWARSNGFRQLRTENEHRNASMRHINEVFGYAPLESRVVLRGPIAD